MNNTKHPPLWSALTSYLIGLLWVCCFFAGFWDTPFDLPYRHLYPLLFALAFFTWAGLTLREKQGPREHFFWLIFTLLTALAIALKRGRAVNDWAYLALHGFAAYWIVCRSGGLTDGETGCFLPLDFLNTAIVTPLGGFLLRIQIFAAHIRSVAARRKHTPGSHRNALFTVLVILAALPLLLLAANLLGQADETFRALLSKIGCFFTFTWEVPRWMEEYTGRFILSLPVGAYLFGLVGTCSRRESPLFDADVLRTSLEKLRFAPTAALTAVFWSFCGLYLLFFLVQASHLLGAFYGNIPGTLTAAQYARSGFFQLCMVMAINFGLLGEAMILSQSPLMAHRGLRICADILMIQSIFLAVTAASKLLLYIHRFGFTPLRLLSGWGILILTAGCLLALAGLHGRQKTMKAWVFFSAASFTLLSFY